MGRGKLSVPETAGSFYGQCLPRVRAAGGQGRVFGRIRSGPEPTVNGVRPAYLLLGAFLWDFTWHSSGLQLPLSAPRTWTWAP